MWGPPSLGLQGADGAMASVCKGSVEPTASQRSQSTGTCPSELKHGTVSWSEQKGGGEARGTAWGFGPWCFGPGPQCVGVPGGWGCCRHAPACLLVWVAAVPKLSESIQKASI